MLAFTFEERICTNFLEDTEQLHIHCNSLEINLLPVVSCLYYSHRII